MKYLLTTCFALLLCSPMAMQSVSANDDKTNIATLRNHTPIEEQQPTKGIPKVINNDKVQMRNYPMQPPLIPHTIRGYEVNLNSNKCMACHSRQRTAESLAPMVSVTHYMDREGNFLAELSPRRYFCNQCHVNQTESKPLVENSFVDMHKLMKQKSQQQ